MKLNPDCIRDILVVAEEGTGYRTELQFGRGIDLPDELQKYSLEEVLYHIRQCLMSELLVKGLPQTQVEFPIADLTPHGHELLNNIRRDTIWNKTKSIGAKLGATSLNAFVQISSNVISEIIKSELGINH